MNLETFKNLFENTYNVKLQEGNFLDKKSYFYENKKFKIEFHIGQFTYKEKFGKTFIAADYQEKYDGLYGYGTPCETYDQVFHFIENLQEKLNFDKLYKTFEQLSLF